MDLIFFNLQTFAIQFVLLLIILFVLNKFIFKPYLAYLDEEERKTKKLNDDYSNIDKIIRNAQDESEEIIKKARHTSKDMIEEAKLLAKRESTNIVSKAEEESKWLLHQAKEQIEKERLIMMSSIKKSLVDLIISFTNKLLKNERLSRDFVEKQIETIK